VSTTKHFIDQNMLLLMRTKSKTLLNNIGCKFLLAYLHYLFSYQYNTHLYIMFPLQRTGTHLVKYIKTIVIYIWLEPSRRAFSKSQNCFPRFDPQFPKIARRSSGRYQLRRQLRRAITFNRCVVGKIREHRCICLVESFVLVLSIRRSDLQFTVNR
jgi:hypothetical protein